MVASSAGIVDIRNTLLPQNKFTAGLSSLGNLVFHLAVQGGHFDFSTQGCLGECNRHFAKYIPILTGEDSMALDADFHQQITGGTAVYANAAAAPDTHGGALVHTAGDVHLHSVPAANLALTLTGIAGGTDDLALAAAGGTGAGGLHGHTHEILLGTDLTSAVTLGAVFYNTIGAAAAMTIGTIFHPERSDLFFTAEGSFLKGQLQLSHHILTTTGAVIGAATAAAAKQVAENITEVKASKAAKTAAEVSALARAKIGVHTGKAKLVVLRALIPIGKHLVGLAYLLEFGLCGGVPGIPVGMELHSLFPVGLFNFIGTGSFFYSQHLIIIAFIICHGRKSPNFITEQ